MQWMTHHSLGREVRINIATSIRTVKVRSWHTPFTGIGLAGCDIAGDLVAGKEPHADEARGPLHGVDAAAVSVEGGSVGVGGGFHGASCAVAELAVDVAVVEGAELGRGRRVEGAGVFGV